MGSHHTDAGADTSAEGHGADGDTASRAARAERESERRYRALFENLSSAFALHEVITDERGAVIDYVWLEVNPAYERMIGRRAEDLIGKRVRSVLPGTDAEWAERLRKIERVALHGESLSHEDYVSRSDRWFENWAFCPGPRQVATLVTETTERHRIADAMAASEARYRALAERQQELLATLEQRVAERTADLAATVQELESFSYSVSHDLRSPLRAIDGFSGVIEEEYGALLPDEGRQALARIRTASQRMATLIDDLLSMSRSSRTELRRARVDVSALASEIVETLRRGEPARAVEVAITPGLEVTADPALARTVLENLLGNAWKYTSHNPSAHVWLARAERPGALEVRDDGAGFDMAYAHKLFGPFHRLHAASEFPGNGIGLATTQRILARHGGRIEAYGELGKGARFTFDFGDGTPGTSAT